MEDKQLNFNQPLMSVRRFTAAVSRKDDRKAINKSAHSIPPLPFYKSELKSGPVRNPGIVPFVWEHSPGRPKEESKLKIHANEQPPVAPKLPPGRILHARDNVSKDPSLSKEQAGKGPSHFQNIPSLDDNATKSDSRDTLGDESSDSGDSYEAYLDALDTFSRTESEFLNCSVSGISGLGGPNLKPSGMFSTDPQTLDFMMGRFLPAAKAMASETPPNVSRKQPVVQKQPEFGEQLSHKKDVANKTKQPSLRYGTRFVHYAEDHEEDESDNDNDEHGKSSLKVCGLLPGFCLKGSFRLLNPVPAVSVRTRVPMSLAARSRAGLSSAGSYREPDKENADYEKKSVGLERTLSHETKKVEKKDIDKDSCRMPNGELQDGHMSRFYNELTQSSNQQQHPLAFPADPNNAVMNGLNLLKKGYVSFQELLADGSSIAQTDSPTSAVEKTLYVDTVHKLKFPKINSCSSDSVEKILSKEIDLEILERSKGIEETTLDTSVHPNNENLHLVDGGVELWSNVLKFSDLSLLPSADNLKAEEEMDTLKGSKKNHDPGQYSVVSANSEVPACVNLENEVQRPPADEISNDSHQTYSEFPVPPTLPKSPTDSWLSRTLSSISSKNQSLRPYLGTGIIPRNQGQKTLPFDAKWETIVKTTIG